MLYRGGVGMPSILGELVTIIIMAFALGMDAFSVSLGMGMYSCALGRFLRLGSRLVFFILLCRSSG